MKTLRIKRPQTAFSFQSVLAVCVSVYCTSIQAAQFGDFTYELINTGTEIEITDYTGTSSEVQIPAVIEGKAVTSVGNFAFRSDDFITAITIPDGVTRIGSSAFQECE
ncbi:MAG: leucine-rich repeat protein, partial [Verrucomicrobiota bacterium]